MNNIKIYLISAITIVTVFLIGITWSKAQYNKDEYNSQILLTYIDNESIDISNFNTNNSYEYTFAVSNLTNNYLKYSLVWTDVVNNLNTIEEINSVTYDLKICDESFNTCNTIIEENTILPATTNNTIASIPNLIMKDLPNNNVIYYKLIIKSIKDINKSFKGSIKLVNESN